MRKKLLLFLSGFFIFSCVFLGFIAKDVLAVDDTLFFSPGRGNYNVGTRFNVEIWLDNVPNKDKTGIKGFETYLVFDKDLVEFNVQNITVAPPFQKLASPLEIKLLSYPSDQTKMIIKLVGGDQTAVYSNAGSSIKLGTLSFLVKKAGFFKLKTADAVNYKSRVVGLGKISKQSVVINIDPLKSYQGSYIFSVPVTPTPAVRPTATPIRVRPSPTPTPTPTQGAVVVSSFFDDFEQNKNWVLTEEIVGGNTCYGKGLAQIGSATNVFYQGKKSFKVEANHALSLKSNHVIAVKKLSTKGQTGKYKYEVYAYIDPATSQAGQAGPEFSIQNTRNISNQFLTTTGGIQYRLNPWDNPKNMWAIWVKKTGGGAEWATFMQQPLEAGKWYYLSFSVNFDTNKYERFWLKGNGININRDISSYEIGKEAKWSEEAFDITLESENLWNNCGKNGATNFSAYYDNAKLDYLGSGVPTATSTPIRIPTLRPTSTPTLRPTATPTRVRPSPTPTRSYVRATTPYCDQTCTRETGIGLCAWRGTDGYCHGGSSMPDGTWCCRRDCNPQTMMCDTFFGAGISTCEYWNPCGICGNAVDNFGNPIAGVKIKVYNGTKNTVTYVTTDSQGRFMTNNSFPVSVGNVYQVWPTGVPNGYNPTPMTQTTTHSYETSNIRRNNTPLNSIMYDAQWFRYPNNGNYDCSYGIWSADFNSRINPCRCNFKFNKIVPSPTPKAKKFFGIF